MPHPMAYDTLSNNESDLQIGSRFSMCPPEKSQQSKIDLTQVGTCTCQYQQTHSNWVYGLIGSMRDPRISSALPVYRFI